ncbi:hypothetical protein [Paraburkholderia sp. BR10954]
MTLDTALEPMAQGMTGGAANRFDRVPLSPTVARNNFFRCEKKQIEIGSQ